MPQHSGIEKAAVLMARSREPVGVLVPLGVNGICFARALAQANIRAVTVTRNIHEPAATTRYAAVVACPNSDTPALVELLAELGRAARVRPVLFVLADVEMLVVSAHREYLRQWYDFALPPDDVVQLLLDKLRFSKWAVAEGLPIASTWTVKNRDDLEAVAPGVVYPCILKPSYRDHRWEQAHLPKGFKLENAEQLRSCYARVSAYQQDVVVSEWVEGPDSNLYIGHIYVPRNGGEPLTFLTHKVRQYPPHIGTTSLAEAWQDDALSELTRRVYSTLDYHGFGAVEMKTDEHTGVTRILEPMAGRCSMIWYPALLQGINLAHVAYCDITRRPMLPCDLTNRPAKWIDERPDLASAIRHIRAGELGLRDYLASLRGRKIYVHLDWRDPRPGIALAVETAQIIAEKIISRIRSW